MKSLKRQSNVKLTLPVCEQLAAPCSPYSVEANKNDVKLKRIFIKTQIKLYS